MKAEKKYTHCDNHDPTKPAATWLQSTVDGLTVYVVFYVLACTWGKCTMCSIPSMMSSGEVAKKDIMKQIDNFFSKMIPKSHRNNFYKIIAAVGGSILDSKVFPDECLTRFLDKLPKEFPSLKILTLETRMEHVNSIRIAEIQRRLANKNIRLEIAIGFETADEQLRNDKLQKGFTNAEFVKFCKLLAGHGVSLKAFLMQKPLPDMSEEEALEDVKKSIDYLSKISSKYNIKINAHINPAYIAKGTILEKAYKAGLYSPPLLQNVCKAALSAAGKNVSIFIGLNDEGLTKEDHKANTFFEKEAVKVIEKFNQTNNFKLLEDYLAITSS